MLNRAIVQGRLVKDITLRKLDENDNLASFVIACERDFKNRETGKRDADFIDAVAKGQLADFAARTFKKGDCIVVSGRLKRRDYIDKNEVSKTAVEIVCDSIYYA